MILYFTDRHMNVLGQASTHLPEGLRVSDDLKTEEVEAGVATLEFTLNYTEKTRKEASRYGAVGNYILRKRKRNSIPSLPVRRMFLNRKSKFMQKTQEWIY